MSNQYNAEQHYQLMFTKSYQEQVKTDPTQCAVQMGYSVDDNTNIQVVSNTASKIHLVVPSQTIGAVDLGSIQAAGVASSVATGATIGTATLTVSSASSLGTVGSAI